MNGERECYEVITELPKKVRLTLSYREEALSPVFRKLGSDEILARLDVWKQQGKEIEVILPQTLLCHGVGRFQICLFDNCCRECDCVEVWFEDGCEIASFEVLPNEKCNDRTC